MSPFDALRGLLFDYTLRTVALGAASLGIVSGALGVYAVLRRRSLLGDAISHAALPGIVLAFMLTGSKATLVLVLGAALAGWTGTLLVLWVVGATRLAEDTALGVVLSVFFGFGLVLLTWIQRTPTAAQAGLDRFLFGQAATLVGRDVAVIAGLGAISLLVVLVFWKEFKLLSFDPAFGAALGIPMRGVEVILTTCLVLAIVAGLQTVGVVLMSAMVVAPAVAARQWTNSLGVMVLLSALFGATAGVSGAVVSSLAEGLPTGPTIVLCATAIVLGSLLGAPERGLGWAWIRRRRDRRELRTESVLWDLYELASQHADPDHGHPAQVIESMEAGRADIARTLGALEARGHARHLPDGTWALTDAGRREADHLVRRGSSPSDARRAGETGAP